MLAGCSALGEAANSEEPASSAPAETAAPTPGHWPTAEELAAVDDRGKMVETPASEACEVYPERMDRGSRQGARGAVVESDADGLATMYAFAAGDNFERIADRFCLSWEAMYALNGHPDIIREDDLIPLTADAKAALPTPSS